MRNQDSGSIRNLYISVTHPLSSKTWKPNLHLYPCFYGVTYSKLQTSEFQRNFWQHNLFMWWRLSVSSILIGYVWQEQKSSCDLPDGNSVLQLDWESLRTHPFLRNSSSTTSVLWLFHQTQVFLGPETESTLLSAEWERGNPGLNCPTLDVNGHSLPSE